MGIFKAQQKLENKVVLITGGSKGLGLVLAKHLIKGKCHIAICARELEELRNAKKYLENLGGTDIYISICDVGDEFQTQMMIRDVINHFGKIDILINNAGIIQVGPMESFRLQDYKNAMDVMYWGIVNTTLSIIPHMKERKSGQIVNITSVGGKVTIPHLLPYSSAKFAAVGFSEGCAAELRKDGIYVTTILPWLMRTGSYVNAFFQEDNETEFKLFSFMSSAPFVALSADRAAKKIVKAIENKKVSKVIGVPAGLAIKMQQLFPEFTSRIFGVISKLLPASREVSDIEKGKEITERHKNAEVIFIRDFGKKAQKDHQELRRH